MSNRTRGPDDNKPDATIIGRIEPTGDDGDEVEVKGKRRPHRPWRRRRSWLLIFLLALLGALLGAAVALVAGRHRAEPPPEPPAALSTHGDYVGELVFAASPQRPQTPPDILPSRAAALYCFYEISGLPADAKLKGRWWREGKLIGDLPLEELQRAKGDHAKGRFTIRPPKSGSAGTEAEPPSATQASGSGDATLAQAPPPTRDKGFPPGIYEVEVTSPGAQGVSVRASFVALPDAAKILAGGGEPDRPLVIRDLVTASAVTEEGKPTEAKRAFPPDADRIYASFSYQGAPAGGTFTVRWYYGDAEITKGRSELEVAGSEGWAYAYLDPAEGKRLPEGQYRVTVHIGNDPKPLASLGFTVDKGDA